MSEQLKFYKGTSDKLPQIGDPGSLYHCTDNGKTYLGTGVGMQLFSTTGGGHGEGVGMATTNGGEIFNDYNNNITDSKGYYWFWESDSSGKINPRIFTLSKSSSSIDCPTRDEFTWKASYKTGKIIIKDNVEYDEWVEGDLISFCWPVGDNKIKPTVKAGPFNYIKNIIFETGADNKLRTRIEIGAQSYNGEYDDRFNLVFNEADQENITGRTLKLGQCAWNASQSQTGIALHNIDGSNLFDSRFGHAEGSRVTALSLGAHAEGYQTIAAGYQAHAEGAHTLATGDYSHAEGYNTYARGTSSHAEGQATTAYFGHDHAEGFETLATGGYSHAEGVGSIASGKAAHAEGENTIASGSNAHAEGVRTVASERFTHAEGYETVASTENAHSEGEKTIASGVASHSEGRETLAQGAYSHAEGFGSWATGDYSHAEGHSAHATGMYSHSEGQASNATAMRSHAEGYKTTASGESSHAEGYDSKATGQYSHARGSKTLSLNITSSAEGYESKAIGQYSHAEGYKTEAGVLRQDSNKNYLDKAGNITTDPLKYSSDDSKGKAAHAEGYQTKATGNYSHAEGYQAKATGDYSHAEGSYSTASASYSHAEGFGTYAKGSYSHAEGRDSQATGMYAHAEGQYTFAESSAQHVEGKFNIRDSANTYAHILGNGTSHTNRSNAHTIDWNGNAWFAGNVTINDGNEFKGNATSATKVNNKLTIGSKNYDGSSAVTISAGDLGLSGAMLFLGTTTTSITDNSTTNPIIINSVSTTVSNGNVVLYGQKEFVWTGSQWEELGKEGSYKVKQTAVTDPQASGNTTSFIDTISQDTNGKITATKKTIPNASTSGLGLVKVHGVKTTAVSVNNATTTSGKYYPVEMNNDNKLFVNVPWKNTDTHYQAIPHAGSSSSTSATATTNGNTYINIVENNARSGGIKIKGTGATTVSSNDSGEIIISSTDNNTTYNNATQNSAGLMSAADKKKLDGIAANANNYTYTLPTASSTTLGGVKIGYSQNAKNYPVQLNTNNQMYVNVPWTDNNTTYDIATSTTAGLTKLYTSSTGSNTDGTMTQSAIKSELDKKLTINDLGTQIFETTKNSPTDITDGARLVFIKTSTPGSGNGALVYKSPTLLVDYIADKIIDKDMNIESENAISNQAFSTFYGTLSGSIASNETKIYNHTHNQYNPHNVTLEQLGLTLTYNNGILSITAT